MIEPRQSIQELRRRMIRETEVFLEKHLDESGVFYPRRPLQDGEDG